MSLLGRLATRTLMDAQHLSVAGWQYLEKLTAAAADEGPALSSASLRLRQVSALCD